MHFEDLNGFFKQRSIIDELQQIYDDGHDTGEDGDILPYTIERNVTHPFDAPDSAQTYINYWVPLAQNFTIEDCIQDNNNKNKKIDLCEEQYEMRVFGAIGLQLKQSDYMKLIPSSVMEKPYQVTYISALDADFNEIWSFVENLDEEEQAHVVQEGVKLLKIQKEEEEKKK